MRATTAVGAWLLCLSWATTAHATPFDLTWNAPAGCPSRQEMIGATRARLGESETAASPELFVRGAVVAERGAFVVTFLVKDATGADVGERKMRVLGRHCAAIEEPAALVLATMISVVGPRAETPTGPPPATDPDTRDTTDDAHEPTSQAPRSAAPPNPQRVAKGKPSRPARLALGAAGVASAGVLPKAGFGVALRTTYSPRSILLFGLETSFEAGASVHTARGEVGFQLLSASLIAGVQVLRSARFELIPVLALRGGVLRTVPSGFQLVKREAHPMALAGAGALLRAWIAPHLSVEALPQAEVVLVRDVFEASEGTTTYFLHQSSPVGARLSVGVGYEFP